VLRRPSWRHLRGTKELAVESTFRGDDSDKTLKLQRPLDTVKKKKKPIFALDPTGVMAGDIVLLLSSPWGHAALCTQPNGLFEATPAGLHRRLVFATFEKRRDRIHVLRPKVPLENNSEGKHLADYAEALYGQAYDFLAAGLAGLPMSPRIKPNGSFFCSQVISRIFIDYGRDPLPGVRPERVRPRDFLGSLALKDVTDLCLREIDPIKDFYDYESVVEAREESKRAVLEMKMLRCVFEKSMTCLGQTRPKGIYSLQQLWEWFGYRAALVGPPRPGSIPASQLETLILETMESEGYWELYRQLHLSCLAHTKFMEEETKNVLGNVADIKRVDSWLRSHEPSGFSLPKRYQYLEAFREWERCTNVELFRRLVETFETLTRDVERIRSNYEHLLSARSSVAGDSA
jgi:hypothetical protein